MADERVLRTTCSYCSVGCNVDLTISEEGKVSLYPNKSYPVNQGFVCPKGFHLLTPFKSDERGTVPLVRDGDEFRATTWDEAYERFVSGFRQVIETHGREAAAFLSTGQIPTEEMALLGAVAKFGMGLYHGDGNTRQCMATAAVAYKQSFGFDAPPFTYQDFEESNLMVFVGANPVINHPIMWQRVKKNKKSPEIIVVDPRRTETVRDKLTTDHYPISPRSDLHFFYALAKILIDEDWVDHEFIERSVSGFEEFQAHLAGLDIRELAARTTIGVERIRDLARKIHEAEAASLFWTMGVNQGHQAVRIAQSIINIALITGQIGRPGTGPNSITGQANAMGSRLYSNTTSLYAGYSFTEREDREKVAELVGIPVEVIPEKNSLAYNQIIDKVKEGEIRALWIVATNPVHSWINKSDFFEAMKNLDFLVVQDLYPSTDTARFADLYLPAAGSAEKSGFFINSERRLGIVQKAMEPPGEAKSDFDIFKGIARAWGCDDLLKEWTDPEAVFRILQRVSKGRPCDISGIEGYQMLVDREGVQWPYPDQGADDQPQRRLFEDGRFYFSDGKARLLYEDFAALPEDLDDEFDTVLLTGRGSIMDFHTRTRTGKVPFFIKKTHSENYVVLSEEDAEGLGVSEGDRVRVSSRRGSVEVRAQVADSVRAGQVFMPMHYMETNYLTFPVFDPYSKEPGYKYAAVKVEKAG